VIDFSLFLKSGDSWFLTINAWAWLRYRAGMVRMASVVVSELPHYVTQRGNRRQHVFFSDGDYVA